MTTQKTACQCCCCIENFPQRCWLIDVAACIFCEYNQAILKFIGFQAFHLNLALNAWFDVVYRCRGVEESIHRRRLLPRVLIVCVGLYEHGLQNSAAKFNRLWQKPPKA